MLGFGKFALLTAALVTACTSTTTPPAEPAQVSAAAAAVPDSPVHDRTVKVGAINLHVLESGKGPTILMLHGFPEYSGIWQPYLSSLGSQYHAVAPDLRGYNLSSQPTAVADYQLEKLMQDVVSLVKSFGPEKVCLVGHDWGGLLSWYLAAHHPELFNHLIILNAPHPVIYSKLYKSDPLQKKMASYVGTLVAKGSEQALAANDFETLRNAVFKTSTHNWTAAEQQGYVDAWKRGLLGPVNYYRAYTPRSEKLAAAIPKVKVPTLVLWGEKDHALSIDNLKGLEAYAAPLQVVRYPEATHWLNHEIVGDITDHIGQFCK